MRQNDLWHLSSQTLMVKPVRRNKEELTPSQDTKILSCLQWLLDVAVMLRVPYICKPCNIHRGSTLYCFTWTLGRAPALVCLRNAVLLRLHPSNVSFMGVIYCLWRSSNIQSSGCQVAKATYTESLRHREAQSSTPSVTGSKNPS